MCRHVHTHIHSSSALCQPKLLPLPLSTSLSPFCPPRPLLFPPLAALLPASTISSLCWGQREGERQRHTDAQLERARWGGGKQTGFRVQVHVQKIGWIESKQKGNQEKERQDLQTKHSSFFFFFLPFSPQKEGISPVEKKMRTTKFEYSECKGNIFLFLPPPFSSPLCHTPPLSLPPLTSSLSISLFSLAGFFSPLPPLHTHAHAPDSFPLISLMLFTFTGDRLQ